MEREEVDRVANGEIIDQGERHFLDEQAVVFFDLALGVGPLALEVLRVVGAAEAVDLAAVREEEAARAVDEVRGLVEAEQDPAEQTFGVGPELRVDGDQVEEVEQHRGTVVVDLPALLRIVLHEDRRLAQPLLVHEVLVLRDPVHVDVQDLLAILGDELELFLDARRAVGELVALKQELVDRLGRLADDAAARRRTAGGA